MRLRLISPTKIEYEGDVEMVLLPGDEGEFGILPHHMKMVASLTEGEVKIHAGKKTESICIKGGVLSIGDDDKVDVMVRGL
jgi:F-type H+-transporting ATPase subunit epsilon